MLEYDRIDISEGSDIYKSSASKKNAIFVTIVILKILVLSHIFAMAVMI